MLYAAYCPCNYTELTGSKQGPDKMFELFNVVLFTLYSGMEQGIRTLNGHFLFQILLKSVTF